MDLQLICALSTAAYAIHALEEFILNWRDWARSALGFDVDWPTFYVTNAAVIVLGFVATAIAPRLPVLALALPALMLINAAFFHVLPCIAMRGRFSPGLITAILLFLPLGVLAYQVALSSGAVTAAGILFSILFGAALMATPIVLLRLKGLRYFQQDRVR